MKYNIHYSCVSHTGSVRTVNQDNIICDELYITPNGSISFPLNGVKSSKNPSVFGVFDGLGGEERGEVASYIAAKNAAAIKPGKDPVAELVRFCNKTNDDICKYTSKNNLSSMGTTAAMLAFTDKGITLCNIGDSKIFRFCRGLLEQISTDHIAAAAFGVKPPLSQNLGIPPTELIVEPYFAKGLYNDGDIYLICSDGLTDMVTTDEIAAELSSKPIEAACTELLEKAFANGGHDNITIILCKIERVPGLFSKRKH